jgi:hypothetical protein
MAAEPVVPLSELSLDLPVPVDGWLVELGRRGLVIVEDDLGRAAVSRVVARSLFAEHRSQQEAAARKRAQIEQQAVEEDQRFRASLPGGVTLDQVPDGVSAGLAMMLADPMLQEARRETMVEHALRGGGVTFHPLNPLREDGS